VSPSGREQATVGPAFAVTSGVRRHAAPLAVLLLVNAALYGRVLGYDFVRYDDAQLLVDHYTELARFETLAGAFWRDSFAMLGPQSAGVFFRPLLVADYALELRLAGPDPAVLHASNLAFHLIATLLAYALFVAFGCTRWLAAGLASILAAHPASALVAAWIPCRNESLLAMACLASTLALLAFLRRGRTLALVLCVGGYAAALFAKESGGALLAVLACVVALERSGRPGETRRLAWAAAAALAISLGWAALRHAALGQSPVGASRLPANLPVLLVYLGKSLFPIDLAVIPHPDDTRAWPGVVAAALLAAAIVANARRLRGPAGLGLIWCAVFLLPSALVPSETWGLEHRLYLPLIGLLLFASQLTLPSRVRAPAGLGVALAFATALAFAIPTARRLPDFADPISYWESAVRSAPHSTLAATQLAWRYFEAGRLSDVPPAAERALALDDGLVDVYLVRANSYAKQGDFERAASDLRRAIELAPDHRVARAMLNRMLRRLEERGAGR